ncbi:L10-interacting MYB domain-containing protein [Bienertia sinuspersici]
MGKSLWTEGPDGSRRLLTIMVEHKHKGTTKFNWPTLAKIFNGQTSLGVTWKQVQNHYYDLRYKYKAWEELQRMTGIAYNPVTKDVDVAEQSLERWNTFLQKYSRFGLALAKKELDNLDLLDALFQGQAAHGVGGTFSPAMAKRASVLSKSVEDLTVDDPKEGSGDSGDDPNDVDAVPNLSYEESISPTKHVVKNVAVAASSGRKRKSDTSVGSDDSKRQASFEEVMKMLSKAAAPQNPPLPTKAELIHDALEKMGIAGLCGPYYFIKAYTFLLSENRHTDGFLALKHETFRWLYLKNMDTP